MRFPGMRRPLRRAATLLVVALLALAAFSVALAYDPTGQNAWVTKEAHKMHALYLFVLIAAAIVFFVVEGLIIYAALRYRKRSDELPPQFHGSTSASRAGTRGRALPPTCRRCAVAARAAGACPGATGCCARGRCA